MSSGMPDPDWSDHPWWGWVVFGFLVAGMPLALAYLLTAVLR